MSEHFAPFDPSDPFDATTELFRTQIVDLVLRAEKITIYRDLDPQRQLECFVAGALTAIVGVCFASVKQEGRDYIMEYLSSSLPAARIFAESLKDDFVFAAEHARNASRVARASHDRKRKP